MRGKLFAAIILIFCLSAFSGAYAAETEVLIEGPEKISEFVGPWADKFQQDNPGIIIRFSERKEDDGFADLIFGGCDIVISRNGPKENSPAKIGKINKTAVAWEGITFAVNPQNPVSKLTVSELRDILNGKIINWEDVGGPSGEITLYGSQVPWVNDFIKDHILNRPGAGSQTGTLARVVNLSSNKEIRQLVSEQALAMGYYSGAYSSAGIKIIAIGGDKSPEYIYPVKEKIPDERYPFRKPLFFWAKVPSKPAVKQFIDAILSKDYQGMLSSYMLYQVKGK